MRWAIRTTHAWVVLLIAMLPCTACVNGCASGQGTGATGAPTPPEEEGALQPAFVFGAGGDGRDELMDAALDGDGGGYLLINGSSGLTSSTLIRADDSGREAWRVEMEFGASALAVSAPIWRRVGNRWRRRPTRIRARRRSLSAATFQVPKGTSPWTRRRTSSSMFRAVPPKCDSTSCGTPTFVSSKQHERKTRRMFTSQNST